MKICPDYCGLHCVNGSCPIALYNDEYLIYVDIYGTIKKPTCKNCLYYKGCEDCYFNGNPNYPCPNCGAKMDGDKMTNEEAIKELKYWYGVDEDEITMAINALEKQIPKPLEWKLTFERIFNMCSMLPHCPVCGNNYNGTLSYGCNYCDICGQRLDWGEDNE